MHTAFAQLFSQQGWLIEPSVLKGMIDRAKAATDASIQAAMSAYADRQAPSFRLAGDVAVIDACGPVIYKRSWMSYYFGAATIEDLQAQFRAALADTSVRTIVFRWDSPGGSVEMVPEFADEVFAARGQKPIISIADTMICSAAYWIACQADAIYVPQSGYIGCIGAYTVHEDIVGMLEQAGIKVTIIRHGANKADDSPYEHLSESARGQLQKLVTEMGTWFDAHVARGRGVAKKVVPNTFGQGWYFLGKEAVAIGMADKIATFGAALGKLSKGRGATGAARADLESPEILSVGAADDLAASRLAAAVVDAAPVEAEPAAPAIEAVAGGARSLEQQADDDATAIAMVLG